MTSTPHLATMTKRTPGSTGSLDRVRGPVEHLDRGDVGLEVPVADQLLHCFGVQHQGARLALVPQPVGRASASSASLRGCSFLPEAFPSG
jgi:hypothetical protein